MASTKKKILIVEDDEMLSSMYAEKFVHSGYSAETAVNGVLGLEKAATMRPDLILLDIIMPKMDGFVTLKKLKQDEALATIPVVMLTNLGQDDDVKRARELGATDYFIKANHTPAEIVSKVTDILKG